MVSFKIRLTICASKRQDKKKHQHEAKPNAISISIIFRRRVQPRSRRNPRKRNLKQKRRRNIRNTRNTADQNTNISVQNTRNIRKKTNHLG